MLPTTLSIALPQKTVESYTDKRGKGRAFGTPTRLVQSIDGLADAPPGYNAELAYLMSIVAAWTYADERALGTKLRYYGIEGAHIRRVSVQNNALLVATTAYLIQSASGKAAVLAFRGTDPANLITLLSDAQVMQRPFSGGHVHSGLFRSVEVVWDEIHEALDAARQGYHLDADGKRKQLRGPLEALYITGHSLGGAMALLAAARLHDADYSDWSIDKLVRGIYTYGQPMAGDDAFIQSCECFRERLHRHVFHRDVVPHLPPKSDLRYVHGTGERRADSLLAGWQAHDDASGRVRIVRAVTEVLLNALEARTSVRDWFPGLSLDDHMPAAYMEVSRRALDAKFESIVPRRSILPRLAADAVDGAKQRFEGAVKNVEGTVKRWFGNGHTVH
jgi:hypothetical protein